MLDAVSELARALACVGKAELGDGDALHGGNLEGAGGLVDGLGLGARHELQVLGARDVEHALVKVGVGALEEDDVAVGQLLEDDVKGRRDLLAVLLGLLLHRRLDLLQLALFVANEALHAVAHLEVVLGLGVGDLEVAQVPDGSGVGLDVALEVAGTLNIGGQLHLEVGRGAEVEAHGVHDLVAVFDNEHDAVLDVANDHITVVGHGTALAALRLRRVLHGRYSDRGRVRNSKARNVRLGALAPG